MRFSGRVMVFGVFDCLHDGHRSFLSQAKERGTELIVGVARDSIVERLKKKTPKEKEEIRIQKLKEHPLVTHVVLGDEEFGMYSWVREYTPDIICLGYDQDTLKDDLEIRMREGILPQIFLETLLPIEPERLHSSLLTEHSSRG